MKLELHALGEIDDDGQRNRHFRRYRYVCRCGKAGAWLDSEQLAKGDHAVHCDDAKSAHYKVICISLYQQDLEELGRKVGLLKQHGWSGANRSHLIRIALAHLSDDDLVKIADDQRRHA